MSLDGLKINVFASYSNNDKDIIGLLKDKLEPYGVDLFLAHSDIDAGTAWTRKLQKEINDCSIFFVLLSENYHQAKFTDQEYGMALAYEKTIVPIRIDNTEPYGFIRDIQVEQCDPTFPTKDVKNIISVILRYSNPGKDFLDILINNLCKADSYIDAMHWIKQLHYYDLFSDEQINSVADAYLTNPQIYGSFIAHPNTLHFLKRHQKQINDKHKKLIEF